MRHLLPLLLTMSLLAAACGDDESAGDSAPAVSTTTTIVTSTTVPEAPVTTTTAAPTAEITLLGRGEYTVGVATVTVTDEARERPLTVDVWFPLTDGTTGEPHQYGFVTGDYFESPLAVDADATSLSPDGPFPLVVYSHGSGGLRFIHSDYTETIASHGYVVVAPDHTGNTAVERIAETSDDSAVIALNRPLDISAVIDAFLDPADAETAPFQPAIDTEQIAVTGHSFGGFTTYATTSGFENEQGVVEADDRIDAIIPLAPAVGSGDDASLLSDEDLGPGHRAGARDRRHGRQDDAARPQRDPGMGADQQRAAVPARTDRRRTPVVHRSLRLPRLLRSARSTDTDRGRDRRDDGGRGLFAR